METKQVSLLLDQTADVDPFLALIYSDDSPEHISLTSNCVNQLSDNKPAR